MELSADSVGLNWPIIKFDVKISAKFKLSSLFGALCLSGEI
jgi:hypothetical protein